jgi:hypothetical protein
VVLHVQNCDTYLDKLCHEFSRGMTVRPSRISKEAYALVELGPEEIVDELARLVLLVHSLVLEYEI